MKFDARILKGSRGCFQQVAIFFIISNFILFFRPPFFLIVELIEAKK